MKLNYNDIHYIIKESTKRIINEKFIGTKSIEKKYPIDINDIIVPKYFKDEVDEMSSTDINMICKFDCFDGQKGTYEQEPLSSYCTLEDVIPGDNSHLEEIVSPECLEALIQGAEDYIWFNAEEFEEDASISDDEMDDLYGYDEDEERYRTRGLGY